MSWARLDDGFWEHPKTEALIAQGKDGVEAIGALALIISYCNRQRRAEIKGREIAMLLGRDIAEAKSVIDILCFAPEGFQRGFLLRKQASDLLQSKGEAYELNSFDDYRSKSEARSNAGRQGGVKSGESRRSKREARAKQDDSGASLSHEAGAEKAAKQTRTPGPDPGPDPVPGPDPGPGSVAPGDISTVIELEALAGNEGWSTQLSSVEIQRTRDLIATEPIRAHEVAYALDKTRAQKPRKPVAYWLGVVEGQRKDAEEARSNPRAKARASPGAPQRKSKIKEFTLEQLERGEHNQ